MDNNGNELIYMTGNSLGLQPKHTKAYVNQELEETGLVLDHDDKMLNFKLALPRFKKAQKAYFSYFLKGFNDSWSKATNENQIIFSVAYCANLLVLYKYKEINKSTLKIEEVFYAGKKLIL